MADLEYERPSRADRSPQPKPPSGVWVVPFTRTTPLVLIQTFDDRVPSVDKNDLNAMDPPVPPLTPKQHDIIKVPNVNPTLVLETTMLTELTTIASGLGMEMFGIFKFNPTAGREVPFPTDSTLSQKVAETEAFKDTHVLVKRDLHVALKKQYNAGKIDVTALEANTPAAGRFGRRAMINPKGIKTFVDFKLPSEEKALRAVIGGSFQGGHVAVTKFAADRVTGDYSAALRYVLIDHFGVDNTDVEGPLPHGSPGQVAFWILQHRRRPGHNPYITSVVIERNVTGNLAW